MSTIARPNAEQAAERLTLAVERAELAVRAILRDDPATARGAISAAAEMLAAADARLAPYASPPA